MARGGFRHLVVVDGGEQRPVIFSVDRRQVDEHLARLCINSSEDLGDWIKGNGVRWQPALAGTN